MDTDGDGDLTYDELVSGIKSRLNLKEVFDEDLKQLMDTLDVNKDGVVSYKEFLDQAYAICMFLSEKRLVAAFQLFDLNDDGSIANEELQ